MTIILNGELLDRLGLGGLPAAAANELLGTMYETLEWRVGEALALTFSDNELEEFSGFVEAGDQGGALVWLQENRPDYQQVVQGHFERLCAEVADASEAILGSVEADASEGRVA